MKRNILFGLSLFFTTVLFAQRNTGFGRGIDFDDTDIVMIYKPSYWFLYLIVGVFIVGLPIVIYERIKVWKGFKTGEYFKIVSNGCIVSTSNKYNKNLEVVKTWNLTDFETQFGKYSYKTQKVNIYRKKLIQIICMNDNTEIIVNVPFDCDYERFFQDIDDYKVAQTINGSFYLYRKR